MHPKEAKFLHYRVYDPSTGAVKSRGGLTVAFFEAPFVDGQVAPKKITFAYAMCHNRDNYVKRLGRYKSAGRLSSEQYAQTYEGDLTSFITNQDALAQSYTDMKRKYNKKKHREHRAIPDIRGAT